jgi:flagellar basal body-associated protein FliL
LEISYIFNTLMYFMEVLILILPIVMILLVLIGGLVGLFFLKRSEKKVKNDEDAIRQDTANKFVNVKDIRDRFLYTNDEYVILYIKITPISIALLSDNEKKVLCKTLTAELSSEQKAYKFLAVSRPVDISPLISEYQDILSNTDDQKQKELLRNEMLVMSNYAMSGDVVERQFYIMIWEKYEKDIEREFIKRGYEFVSKFESGNVRAEILKEQDIVRLCNLINNPAYSNVEDTEFEPTIPILDGGVHI